MAQVGLSRKRISSINALAEVGPAPEKWSKTGEMAVLGGEVWLVVGSTIHVGIPLLEGGPPGVYAWNCDRLPGEGWRVFVARSAVEARNAVETLAAEETAALPAEGRLMYNLTWLSRRE